MPAEVILDEVRNAGLEAARAVAGGVLPEPWRSAVLAALEVAGRLLRPDLVVVEVGADTVVRVEAE